MSLVIVYDVDDYYKWLVNKESTVFSDFEFIFFNNHELIKPITDAVLVHNLSKLVDVESVMRLKPQVRDIIISSATYDKELLFKLGSIGVKKRVLKPCPADLFRRLLAEQFRGL